MKQGLKIVFASALATAALLKGVPALAESAPQNVSIVSTADLDLSTDAGRQQLDQRLVVAVNEVCGTASDADLVGKNQARQCRHELLANARAKGESLIASNSAQRTIILAVNR